MNNKDILNALNLVDDKFIENSLPKEKAKSKKIRFRSIVAAVLAVLVGLRIAVYFITDHPLSEYNTNPSVNSRPPLTLNISGFTLKEVEYPDMAKLGTVSMDEWYDSLKKQYDQYEGYNEGLDGFFAETTVRILGSRDGENRIYSPLSLYMALGMLAETTDGNSRKQILDLLGYNNIEDLRKQAEAVWNGNFCDNGLSRALLASSIWLRDDLTYNDSTLEELKNTYYASSYSGEMGSEDYNKALQDWINHNTGNLLTDYTQNSGFDPETVLGLVSAVYFDAQWTSPFSEENNTEDIFRSQAGEIECEFMNKTYQDRYYWAENFSAVSLSFDQSGSMWFFLPDQNVSIDEVLSNEEIFSIISEPYEYANSQYSKINFSVPKFDISSETELSKDLKELGVTDVFDMHSADFSPLTEYSDELYLSKAKQSSRVAIDETGCVAASYTEMYLNAGSAPPEDDEIDFILDRPFIFVITGRSGMPMFIGVVETP